MTRKTNDWADMRIVRWLLYGMLLASIIGCENTTDPLINWQSTGQIHYRQDETHVYVEASPCDKAIAADAETFINQLPRGRYWIVDLTYFENGFGQHAVKIAIGMEGSYDNYVLFYDAANKRTKTRKFCSGHYAC